MKKILVIIVIITNLSINLLANENYEPGVILLKVKNPNIVSINETRVVNGSSEFQNILNKYGILRSKKLPSVNVKTDGSYRIDFPENTNLKMLRDELLTCQDVRYINFNYLGTYCGEPNDTYWSEQWALDKIQMPMCWDICKSDHSILIGILDCGILYTHEDLSENCWLNPDEVVGDANGDGFPGIAGVDDDGDGLIDEDSQGRQPGEPGYTNDLINDDDENGYSDDIRGWDFGTPDNDPLDEGGHPDHPYHGTRVSGVIAAKTYNGIGVAGIAGGWQNQPGVQLVALKLSDQYGNFYVDEVKNAILYLVRLHQRGYTVIANMSFAFNEANDDNLLELKDAIDAARDEGVILVAAAGNVVDDPKNPDYNHPDVVKLPAPARWDGVLAIGASTDGESLEDEQRSDYSMYDSYSYAKLLLVAPVDGSINVYTTYGEPNEKYINWFHGTSAACPIAVGVIAHILSINPVLGWEDIEQILASTADKIGSYYYMDWLYGTRSLEVGYGRLNAYKALKYTVEHYGGTFNNDLTIATGEVFNLEPGITLKFASNTSLIVNGTLNANGTSSNKITFTSASSTPQKGDWEGIIFDNANNSSSIQYCTIEYAVRGINTNATNITIEYSDINNNSGNGIKCHEASPTIYHNTIESNGIGILCESNSSPYINNNYVVNNISYGIYCTQTSPPDIRHNEISNNGPGGLCCVNGSSPNLIGRSSSEPYGANAILSNGGNGVLVFSNSNPNLGYHFGYQAGYNDIYNHSYKQVANYTGNTIFAWKNWWGTANPSSELFYGSVDYSAHLTSSSPYAGPDWSQSLAKSLAPVALNSPNDVEEYLLKALESEGAGKYEEAVEDYRYVTDQYGNTEYGPFALSRLMACRVKQGDITIEKDYLNSVQQKNDTSQTGTTALLWQPLVEVRAGNEQEALVLCDNIKNHYSDANLIKDAKFLKGSIQLYEMNDVEAAKKTYDEFIQEYPQDPLVEHIKIILENYQSYDLLLPRAQPRNRTAAPVMPTQFQLSQNFPNPFNPETEIKYQLPEDSHIRIEIFNLMGQKICTLVNKKQPMGFYSVHWNGRDGSGVIVASGVYLYRLHANKFMGVKKMLLLR